MKLMPTQDRVLIKLVDIEEKKTSLIILPDSSKKQSFWGTIMELGPDVADLKKGQVVFFSDLGFDPITIEKQEYFIGREEHVLLIKSK